ncbi:hypothetical protein C8Q74DRAFT_1236085 [Fomes fomentarius]|nr:hypothetical protein C8Q74DRAFT_1236085 [Fomes fomentarius]
MLQPHDTCSLQRRFMLPWTIVSPMHRPCCGLTSSRASCSTPPQSPPGTTTNATTTVTHTQHNSPRPSSSLCQASPCPPAISISTTMNTHAQTLAQTTTSKKAQKRATPPVLPNGCNVAGKSSRKKKEPSTMGVFTRNARRNRRERDFVAVG